MIVNGNKGLMKGEPLSSYVFVAVMEGTHLRFANDLMISAAANVNAINAVATIFDHFCAGLIFNPSKHVFFWRWCW